MEPGWWPNQPAQVALESAPRKTGCAFFDNWLLVGILTSERSIRGPAINHKEPQLGEASPRLPLRGGAFSLPVHKRRPQNFDEEGGCAMLLIHQRVAANPPNLLARNRAPLGDSRGAFLLSGCQGKGGGIVTPQTQFLDATFLGVECGKAMLNHALKISNKSVADHNLVCLA